MKRKTSEERNMKKLNIVFAVLAILLSDIMCVVVSSSYTNMVWGIKYEGYSAPAWVSFLYVVPFAAAIIICLLLAAYFRKKAIPQPHRS